jgi:hypothetical protein
MNPDKVKDRIEEIKGMMGDNESAHIHEDLLWRDVLSAIADGTCENPQECARLAITTDELDFERWYA